MPVLRTVVLLWFSAYMWLPAQTWDALVISRRDTSTQGTKDEMGIRPIKKRSINSFNLVSLSSVRITSTVTSRFAHTTMTSKAVNKAQSSQEIFFEVELPKTAFITNFSMEIDGQVYNGDVKEKEAAKKQYDKAVSSGETAGLVKASGRKMEIFSVSVNIAAKSSVNFILTYEELLQRKLGQYEILTRVTPKQPVNDFQIVADIYEPEGISFVGVNTTFLSNDQLHLVEQTVTDTKAHISFSPTLEQQRKCPRCNNTIIDGDFIIKYDVKREELGEVQIVNGYFVHFFAPPNLPTVPKNVVFVIDRSGSMNGIKIIQTREAIITILKDLYEEDHFALILFDNNIITWKDSLTKATKENVDEAIAYVQELRAEGSTNINDAVMTAVRMLMREREDNNKLLGRSADMVVLLTDGMPNSGETNPSKIQDNVRSASGGKMSMFCLGFGNDVDYSFLDVLCRQNKGMARRIFEGSDAASQLKGFYKEVARPLLLEVDLRYPNSTVDLLTTNHYSQLFEGSEIVVAGQLKNNDMNNFLVEVVAYGPEKDLHVNGRVVVVDWDVIYPQHEYIFGDFTERLWAYLTIQQLLEKSDIGTQQEKNSTLAKILEMSMQYSFVTPLTSMVVTKPETLGENRFLTANKLTENERQQQERHHGIPSLSYDTLHDIQTDDYDYGDLMFYDMAYSDHYILSSCSPAVDQFFTHLCVFTGLLMYILQ